MSTSRINTQIATSEGLCDCTVITTNETGVFQVDLWQGGKFLETTFTKFRACVYFRLAGDRYTIIRHTPERYNNPYWLELEDLISGVILTNT